MVQNNRKGWLIVKEISADVVIVFLRVWADPLSAVQHNRALGGSEG